MTTTVLSVKCACAICVRTFNVYDQGSIFPMHGYFSIICIFQVVQNESVDDTIGKSGSQDIVIENNSATEITMIADHSEVQSANALLRLATSHNGAHDDELVLSEMKAKPAFDPKTAVKKVLN